MEINIKSSDCMCMRATHTHTHTQTLAGNTLCDEKQDVHCIVQGKGDPHNDRPCPSHSPMPPLLPEANSKLTGKHKTSFKTLKKKIKFDHEAISYQLHRARATHCPLSENSSLKQLAGFSSI